MQLGINQSPTGPSSRTIQADQIIPSLIDRGLPILYGVQDNGAGPHHVRIIVQCGPIVIPLDLTTQEARTFAALICEIANQPIPIEHPVLTEDPAA